jgi:hypothetical protein
VVLGVALLSSTKLIVVVPLKEDKDDRYGSETIGSGFIFQLFALETKERTSGACSDAPSSEMIGARRKATAKL